MKDFLSQLEQSSWVAPILEKMEPKVPDRIEQPVEEKVTTIEREKPDRGTKIDLLPAAKRKVPPRSIADLKFIENMRLRELERQERKKEKEERRIRQEKELIVVFFHLAY